MPGGRGGGGGGLLICKNDEAAPVLSSFAFELANAKTSKAAAIKNLMYFMLIKLSYIMVYNINVFIMFGNYGCDNLQII
jgi:hypothetical protein